MSDRLFGDIGAWLLEVSSGALHESGSEATPTRVSRKSKRLGNQFNQSITERPLREGLPARTNSPATPPQRQGTEEFQVG